jgi:hypothetical protein
MCHRSKKRRDWLARHNSLHNLRYEICKNAHRVSGDEPSGIIGNDSEALQAGHFVARLPNIEDCPGHFKDAAGLTDIAGSA